MSHITYFDDGPCYSIIFYLYTSWKFRMSFHVMTAKKLEGEQPVQAAWPLCMRSTEKDAQMSPLTHTNVGGSIFMTHFKDSETEEQSFLGCPDSHGIWAGDSRFELRSLSP